MEVVICRSLKSRILGLFDRSLLKRVICITPCNAIHTFGLKNVIDVCFCDSDLQVIASHRNVLPWKYISCTRSSFVLERISSSDPWPLVGEKISLSILQVR